MGDGETAAIGATASGALTGWVVIAGFFAEGGADDQNQAIANTLQAISTAETDANTTERFLKLLTSAGCPCARNSVGGMSLPPGDPALVFFERRSARRLM